MKIPAAELKAKCLKLMDEDQETDERSSLPSAVARSPAFCRAGMRIDPFIDISPVKRGMPAPKKVVLLDTHAWLWRSTRAW